MLRQTDSYIYIATERVVPLRWHVMRKSLSPETIKWGLYSVAVGLSGLYRGWKDC
jgi:SCY1-like protein 1